LSKVVIQNLIKPEIQKAIQDDQEVNAKRLEVTIDEVTRMHREAYQVAKDSQQATAMTASANNLAKLHGLIIDKQKIEVKNHDFESNYTKRLQESLRSS